MEGKSLEKLRKIMKIEGTDRKSGRIAREIELEDWIKTEIVEIETSQSVIKRGLSSEDEDFIKYYMAYKMGDLLMDDCIDVKSTKTKITTKIWALRRK